MVVNQIYSSIMSKGKNVIILVLAVICLIQYMTCPKKGQVREPVEIVNVPSKPITYPVSTYVPEAIRVKEIVFVDRETVKWETKYEVDRGDTAAIRELYKAYFTGIDYSDTIVKDSLAFIVVNDHIAENRIQSRTVEKTFYPSVYAMMQPYQARLKMFAGVGIGGNLNSFGLTGKILLQTKTDKVYCLSYDPLNRYFEISLYWKLTFIKDKSNGKNS